MSSVVTGTTIHRAPQSIVTYAVKPPRSLSPCTSSNYFFQLPRAVWKPTLLGVAAQLDGSWKHPRWCPSTFRAALVVFLQPSSKCRVRFQFQVLVRHLQSQWNSAESVPVLWERLSPVHLFPTREGMWACRCLSRLLFVRPTLPRAGQPTCARNEFAWLSR